MEEGFDLDWRLPKSLCNLMIRYLCSICPGSSNVSTAVVAIGKAAAVITL